MNFIQFSMIINQFLLKNGRKPVKDTRKLRQNTKGPLKFGKRVINCKREGVGSYGCKLKNSRSILKSAKNQNIKKDFRISMSNFKVSIVTFRV